MRIVPTADAVPITAPVLGSDSVTVKFSSPSSSESPSTHTVIVWVVWPEAKLTVPEGNWSNRVKSGKKPPTMLDSREKKPANGTRFGSGRKSEPSTAAPLTSQLALTALSVSPVRVTVMVAAPPFSLTLKDGLLNCSAPGNVESATV